MIVSSEAMILLAMIRLMVFRLTRSFQTGSESQITFILYYDHLSLQQGVGSRFYLRRLG